jgi:predicted ABC-type sugar transport system permease subunit
MTVVVVVVLTIVLVLVVIGGDRVLGVEAYAVGGREPALRNPGGGGGTLRSGRR